MLALQKLWKMFFISSKKLFSFSRYSNFCIFVFPSFFSRHPLLSRLIQEKSSSLWRYQLPKEELHNTLCLISWERKRCDIEILSFDSIKYRTLLWKNHAENVHQELAPDPFLILLNNPTQSLHARNSF